MAADNTSQGAPQSGPPQVIPGLSVSDLMGLASTLDLLKGGAFKALMSQVPGAALLSEAAGLVQKGASQLLQTTPAGLQAMVSAAAQKNPLLGPIGGDVVSRLAGQAAPLLQGIQTPVKTAMNLANLVKSFGSTIAPAGPQSSAGPAVGAALSSLSPTMLATKAANLIYQNVTSPFLLPPAAELQVLHKAFQSVLLGASGTPAASPVGSAGAKALQEILQLNQKLTSQLLQANQLFVRGNPLLTRPLQPPPQGALAMAYNQLLSAAATTVSAISSLSGPSNPAQVNPLGSLIKNEAQVGEQFVAAQGQLASKLVSSLFAIQIGLPVSGTTPAVTPGLLPFNLINALIGLQPPKRSGLEVGSPPRPDTGRDRGPEGARIDLAKSLPKPPPGELLKALDPTRRVPVPPAPRPALFPSLLPKSGLS